MPQRILLLGGNFYPELTGIGKYNSEMTDWFSRNGHECAVVTTYPYYPYWTRQHPYDKHVKLYKKEVRSMPYCEPITIHRCWHYVPKIPCGSKRVLSDLTFFLTAFFQVLSLLFIKKYDCIIAVAPPFQLGLLALLYAKIKNSKFVYHNQDLQIDAANELGMIKSKILLKSMFACERFILKNADYVSSISEGMVEKLKKKLDREIVLFPNWSDIKNFNPVATTHEFKQQYNFLPTEKIVLYSGAIGEKQGLQTVLASARDLAYRRDIKFVICGCGPYQQRLKSLAEEMNLDNVLFLPLQPKETFNEFLNMASIHLVMQKSNVNDLVMPSKLATIMAVGGLAIVAAERGTSLHRLIETNQIGVLIEPEDQHALSTSILACIDVPQEEIMWNARQYAEENLAIDKIVSQFSEKIIGYEKKQNAKKIFQEALHVDIKAR